MLRRLFFCLGICAFVTVAVAATDIPTRYSGAFPSTQNISNIAGTFTGASLSLRGVARKKLQVAGNYSCSKVSDTQVRCNGTLRAVEGSYSDKHSVLITWSGGRPVAMSGNH